MVYVLIGIIMFILLFIYCSCKLASESDNKAMRK